MPSAISIRSSSLNKTSFSPLRRNGSLPVRLVGIKAARSPSLSEAIKKRAASLACLNPLPSALQVMLSELSSRMTNETGPPPAKSPAPV